MGPDACRGRSTRVVGIVGDVGEEGRRALLPDAAGQADAALERRSTAEDLEIVERRARQMPDLDAPEAVGVRIHLPQRALFPAEGRADRLEDPWRRLAEASRFGERPGRCVLGSQTPCAGPRVVLRRSVRNHRTPVASQDR